MDLFDLREEYTSELLDEKTVPFNPIELFKRWFTEAQNVKIYEPNSFTLATADKNNTPYARILLLKAFDNNGFTFFTNYNSSKGRQLFENPQAAMVFHWGELERQVRITGNVEQLSDAESDKYFETRPVGSRLGAWASPQSQVIEGRAWLEARHHEFRQHYKHGQIPRPKNWGGYLLIPETIEFWQGRPNRLHDRIEYFREGDDWEKRRLAP
jgi:pyridoxamine 5'-phosphate oxidase